MCSWRERAAITAELVIRNNENIQRTVELQNDVEVIEKKITVMEIGILWLVQKVLYSIGTGLEER